MKEYKLIGRDGKPYLSTVPGRMGGHRKLKIYGQLDCPSALRYIAKGHYVEHRVFFADEETAIAAGYRPCGICMREAYKRNRQSNQRFSICRYSALDRRVGGHELFRPCCLCLHRAGVFRRAQSR